MQSQREREEKEKGHKGDRAGKDAAGKSDQRKGERELGKTGKADRPGRGRICDREQEKASQREGERRGGEDWVRGRRVRGYGAGGGGMRMGEERGRRGRWGGGAYVERLGGPEEAGWG